jgi:hypothetical protein
MRKEDYITQLMAYYKQIESGKQKPGPGFEIRLREPDTSWNELVDRAAHHGLDHLEVNELIRIADYAKDILRST